MKKQRILCATFAVFVPFFILPSNAEYIQWSLEKTTGVRFTSYSTETTALSGIACGYLCMLNGRCAVANYNSVTMACTLTNDALEFVTDTNWDSFIVVPGMLSNYIFRL